MSIAHQITASGSSSALGSTLNTSLTVSSGDNRYLVVYAHGNAASAANNIPSTVTFDGQSLTKLDEQSGFSSNYYKLSLWVLKDPNITTADVIMTFAGDSDSRACTASVYTGVDTYGVFDTATNATANPTDSVTTTKPNSFVSVGVLGKGGDTDPFAPDNSETERADFGTGVHVVEDTGAWCADIEVVSPGAQTVGCTMSVADRWLLAHIELLAVRDIDLSDSISIAEDITADVSAKEIDVSDTITITEGTTESELTRAGLSIFIDGVDRTRLIRQEGFTIENILTRQVDRCKFVIGKVDGNNTLNFRPVNGREVYITDSVNHRIFGGVIVRVTQQLDSMGLLNYTVDCEDYTRWLDRKLVVNTYSNMTINAIISDINDNFLDGFTITNVDATTVLDYIAFNYEPVSKALTQLADRINYDWYVDYNKDIHFFAKDASNASFDLEDGNASFFTNSLKIKRDNTQIKNVVHIRGGEFLANTFTTEIEQDSAATRNIFDLGYRYEDLSVTLTGQSLTVGVDGKDLADSYDVLWNQDDKIIKFTDARKPSATSIMRIGGRPYFPVRTKIRNQPSIDAMISSEGGSGEYEFLIVDKSINTKEGARERGKAELQSYKDSISEGRFTTLKNGLVAGQRIRINSTAHDMDEYFIINRVTSKLFANNTLRHEVSIVTTKTIGIIEYLQKILTDETKKIIINENEIIDVVEDATESLGIGETVTSRVGYNLKQEAFELSTTFTASPLDFETEFVVGPYAPTGKAGRLIEDGSTTAGWYMIGSDVDASPKIDDVKSAFPIRSIGASSVTGVNWTANGAYQLTAASEEFLIAIDETVNPAFTHCVDLEESTSDHLAISPGDQSGLNITGDLTLEMVVKFESFPVSHENSLIARSGSPSNYAYWWSLNESKELTLRISEDGNTYELYNTSALSLSAGTFYHLAVSWDASESTASFYVDGEFISSETLSATSIHNPTASLNVGAVNTSSNLDGKINEARVWARALTAQEIKLNYNTTLPTASAFGGTLKGWWTFNNTLVDGSGNGNDLTFEAFAGYVADPAPLISSFPIAGGDISITGWFKFDSIGSGIQTLVSKHEDTGAERAFSFQYDESNDNLELIVSDDGTATETLNSNTSLGLVIDRWYHLGFAWDASASTAYFYVDSVDVGDDTGAMIAMNDSDAYLAIGVKDPLNPENFFDGQVASVEIAETLRSDADMVTSYNKNKRVLTLGGGELG